MLELYQQLSKATDVFNESRIETEQISYYEVLKSIENRYDEVEVMKLIIELYSDAN